MSKPRVSSGARVTVTVEVWGCGAWGPECTVKQVHDQAAEYALGHLRQLFEKDGSIKIVGTPKIIAVLAENNE